METIVWEVSAILMKGSLCVKLQYLHMVQYYIFAAILTKGSLVRVRYVVCSLTDLSLGVLPVAGTSTRVYQCRTSQSFRFIHIYCKTAQVELVHIHSSTWLHYMEGTIQYNTSHRTILWFDHLSFFSFRDRRGTRTGPVRVCRVLFSRIVVL